MARDQEARGQNRHPKRAETQSAQSSLQARRDPPGPGSGCAPVRMFKFVKGCGELAHADRYWLSIPGRKELFLCPAYFKNYRLTSVQDFRGLTLASSIGSLPPSLAERDNEGKEARKMRSPTVSEASPLCLFRIEPTIAEKPTYMTAPSIQGTNSSAPNP